MKYARSTAVICAFAALAGMTVLSTGCAVGRGQETAGAYIDDAGITTSVKAKFVEDKTVSASAISVAGLLERSEAGMIPKGSTVVLTVTGHGLKDPQWALRTADGDEIVPTVVPVDADEIASVLGLVKARA